MTRWKLNRCPRCGGSLFIDSDMDGWYEQCLNCSYRSELKNGMETTGKKTGKDMLSKV